VGISSDAITGFAGVVTGSVITGGFQYTTARRSQHRRAKASRRLVAAELGTYRAVLDFMAAGGALQDVLVAQLQDRSWWNDNAGRLAEGLSREAWDAVEYVYFGMAAIVAEARERGSIRPDRAADARAAIDRAVPYLEPPRRRLLGTHRGHAAKPPDGDTKEHGG
jgi:hypothetical protein